LKVGILLSSAFDDTRKAKAKSPQPPFTKGGRGGIFPTNAGFAGAETVMKNWLAILHFDVGIFGE